MSPRERNLERIREYAAEHGTTLADVFSPKRDRHIVRARWKSFALLYEQGMSASQIGRYFKRDHTTVLHGLAQVPELQRPLGSRWPI